MVIFKCTIFYPCHVRKGMNRRMNRIYLCLFLILTQDILRKLAEFASVAICPRLTPILA